MAVAVVGSVPKCVAWSSTAATILIFVSICSVRSFAYVRFVGEEMAYEEGRRTGRVGR